jgi:hypothetical protein
VLSIYGQLPLKQQNFGLFKLMIVAMQKDEVSLMIMILIMTVIIGIRIELEMAIAIVYFKVKV